MQASDKAIHLIQEFEGLFLKAYPDPATNAEPWTIGWGSTRDMNGEKIQPGMVINRTQAEAFMLTEIREIETALNALHLKLNQNMFDALVSFVYNCGIGNLRSSTLLKKLQEQDFPGAEQEFLKWDKANGKAMRGLTRRRQAEASLFASPV